MENDIANLKPADLFSLGMKCHHGAVSHPEIELAQNPAGRILSDLNAAEAAYSAHGLEEGALAPLTAALAKVLDDSYFFAQAVKGALVKRYGPTHNSSWTATGFRFGLAVPRGEADLRTLLNGFSAYFEKNPTHEVPALQVTAAQADSWSKSIEDALKAISDQERVIRTKLDARENTVQGLRNRLRGLTFELIQLIGRDDARWEDFGLNIPAEPATPSQPVNVAVNTSTPEELLVTCDAAPYADHYRCWKQGVGSSLPPAVLASSKEPIFLLRQLPGGERLNIFVSVINKAGNEGPLSAPVEARVQAREAAA
jgi:hypothetical protein